MRSCSTTSRSLSLITLLRNSATSLGCSTSSCSAAPRTASMQLLQEHSAGIPGATAALTPVPITRRRSWGCFLTRLKNFLEHRKQKCSLFTMHFLACLKSSGTDSRSSPEPLELLQNTNQPAGTEFSIPVQQDEMSSHRSSWPPPNQQQPRSLFAISCKWMCMVNASQNKVTISNLYYLWDPNWQLPGHWVSQTPFPMKFWKK